MKKKILLIFLLGVILINYCLPILAYNTDDPTEEKTNQNNVTSQNDLNVKGINSFGTLLASEVASQIDESKINKEYDILDIEINDKEATVNYKSKSEARIIVGIYDDTGKKLIATGNMEVSSTYSGYDKKILQIEIDKMPENFYIKAFIVDENLNPITKAYESPKYTKYMQELQEMKTDDFKPEKVLNLDDDNTTNFAIYGNNTILIEEIGNTNKLKSQDAEKQIYVFENIDSKMKSLKKENKVSYKLKDGNVILINVANISINGTTATIAGSNSKMQDFFDYVKIETSPTTDDYHATQIENNNIQYKNVKNDAQGYKVQKLANNIIEKNEYTISLTVGGRVIDLGAKIGDKTISDSVTINGTIEAKIGMELLCYVNKQNQYIKYNQATSLTLNVSLSGKVDVKIPLLQGLKVNTLNMIEIDFTPYARFEISASWSINNTVKQDLSITFNNGSFDYKYTEPRLNMKSSISTKITAFAGLDFSPTIKVSDFIVLKCNNRVGLKAETKDIKTNDEHIHTCNKCICGTLYCYSNVEPTLSISELEFKDKNEVKIKIKDFHYDFERNKFILESCPNIKYRVKVDVTEFTGRKVKGAEILGTYLDVAPITDENGEAKFYLQNGTYTIRASSKAGYTRNKNIEIEDNPVYLRLTTENGYNEDLNCYYGILGDSDVEWEYYANTGRLYILGTGNMPSQIYEGGDFSTGTSYSDVSGYWHYGGSNIKEIVIGKNITGIGRGAFRNLSKLEKVTIEADDLKYIGRGAFDGCDGENFKKIIIPDTVEQIGPYAFQACKYLEEIKLPKNLKKINEGSFDGCTELKNIELPNSIVEIGDGAFSGCGLNKGIKIPTKTKKIGKDAFLGTKLENIVIPDNVNYVGEGCFSGCKVLKSLKFSNKMTTIKAYTCSGCERLENVEIPNSITTIEEYAFNHCDLEEVTIPNAEFIGNGAFSNCYSLRKLYIPKKAVVMPTAFEGCEWDSSFNPVEYISKANEIEEKEITKLALYNDVVSDTSYFGVNNTTKDNITKATVQDLIPKEQYIIVAVKECYDTNLLGADNLIYITQMEANDNGKVEFSYVGGEEDTTIVAFGLSKVKRIVLDQEKVNLEAKQKYPLIAKISPKYVVDSKIIWTSSDTKIAKVSEEGEIEGVSDGIAEITAKIGDVEAKCKVVVGKSMLGDVNGDDKVTLADCTKILAHVKKTKLLTEEEQKRADVNRDGKVTLADYTKVLAHVKKTKLLE